MFKKCGKTLLVVRDHFNHLTFVKPLCSHGILNRDISTFNYLSPERFMLDVKERN